MHKFNYVAGQYCNGTTAIQVFENGEPWCTMSVNLEDYGMTPTDENCIFVPMYKIDDDTYNAFAKDLVKEVVNDFVPIGYGNGIEVRLVDNWKDICQKL